MNRVYWTVLLICAMLVFSSSDVHTAVLFSDDFESPGWDGSNWDATRGTPGTDFGTEAAPGGRAGTAGFLDHGGYNPPTAPNDKNIGVSVANRVTPGTAVARATMWFYDPAATSTTRYFFATPAALVNDGGELTGGFGYGYGASSGHYYFGGGVASAAPDRSAGWHKMEVYYTDAGAWPVIDGVDYSNPANCHIAYGSKTNAMDTNAESKLHDQAGFHATLQSDARVYIDDVILEDPRPSMGLHYRDTVMANNPVGYWRMNETHGPAATPASPIANLGSETGSSGSTGYANFLENADSDIGAAGPPSATFPGFGSDNKSAHFDPTLKGGVPYTQDGVYIGDYSGYRITGALTLEAWINRDTAGQHSIVGKYDSVSGKHGYLFQVNSSGNLELKLSTDGSADVMATSLSSVPIGQWTHVAATFQPDTYMRLYINGDLDQEVTSGVPTAIFNAPTALRIGYHSGGFLQAVDGSLDEVAIYGGALNEFDIARNYLTGVGDYAAEQTPTQPQLAGLQLWYRADAGALSQNLSPATDGEEVGFWVDKSGNMRTAWQTDSGLQPTLQTNAVNGLPAVEFDGHDALFVGDFEVHDNSQGLTIFAVSQADNLTTNSMITKYDATESQREWQFQADNFNVQDNPGSYDGNTLANYSNDSDWHIITGMWAPGGKAQVFVDGILVAESASIIADIGDTDQAILMGAGGIYDTFDQFFDGMIAELLVYNRALEWGQHNTVGFYLAGKYGLHTAYVPEPGSLLLFGLGVLGLAAFACRRRKK